MNGERDYPERLSPFLDYLATHFQDGERIPALAEISQELGISQAALREQLEVARAFGVVEVRPKTGIRRQPYTFAPAMICSMQYAMAVDEEHFFALAELRNRVEESFWYEAARKLNHEDHLALQNLIKRADEKLNGIPVQIPHPEHRELHMTIYKRLNNPFVTGILEAYWVIYEAVGLAVYTDYAYLKTVWQYHQKMVEAICSGNLTAGYQALVEHVDLLQQRSQSLSTFEPVSRQKFE